MKAYEIISRNKILEIIIFNRFVNYEISFTSRHIYIPMLKIYRYSKFCKVDIFDFGKVGSSLPLSRSRDSMSLSLSKSILKVFHTSSHLSACPCLFDQRIYGDYSN